MNQFQLTSFSKPLCNFNVFAQEIKKGRLRPHLFGTELNKTNVLVF